MNAQALLSNKEFFENYWGKKATVLKTMDKHFENKIDVLEIIKNNMLFYPELRVFGSNGSESPLLYTESNRHRLSEKISAKKMLNIIDNTGTIKITSIERFDSALRSTKESFEKTFSGSKISMNLYMSKGPCYGVTPHFDSYHIFAIQMEGSKTWKLGNIVTENPHEDFIYKGTVTDEFLDELVTKPGDILYIPPGLLHHVYTDESSIHVTVGIHTVRVYQNICDAILRLASKHNEFRGDMPMKVLSERVVYENLKESDLETLLAILKNELSIHHE